MSYVPIDHPTSIAATKARRSLYHGHVVWVTNEHGVIVIKDRVADHVRSGWEVDQARCSR
jgi:hypothetical protein